LELYQTVEFVFLRGLPRVENCVKWGEGTFRVGSRTMRCSSLHSMFCLRTRAQVKGFIYGVMGNLTGFQNISLVFKNHIVMVTITSKYSRQLIFSREICHIYNHIV
jgi:hypothetical protein